MIKNYLKIFMLFVCGAMIAQSNQPIITGIIDGDCPGGLPKLIEIYADGTVDFANIELEKYSTNSMAFGSGASLSALGVRNDEFVYVTKGDISEIATEFPNVAAADLVTNAGAANNNGDDAIRLYDTVSMVTLDQYGTEMDGTGEVWEYTDSFAKRNDGTGPNGGTFSPANWTFTPPGSLDNMTTGVCKVASNDPYEVLFDLGNYSTTGSSAPSITILSPLDGSTEATGDVTVQVAVSNFNVDMPSMGDGYIIYTVDNGTATDKFDTTSLNLSSLSAGSHTISMELVDNTGGSLSPAVTDMVSFDVNGQQTVNDIASLRAGFGSTDTFILSSEAIVSYAQQDFRGQVFIQDATAGILIDDPNDVLDLDVDTGDGLTGLQGTLSEFNGLLQFTPVSDLSSVSTGNNVSATTVTAAMLTANPEDYESELVTLTNIQFDPADADGTNTFVDGTEYVLSDGSDTFTLRTSFEDADYTDDGMTDGDVIPSELLNITGIITERNNGSYFITPRESADFETLSFGSISRTVFTVSPNPANGGKVNINSAQNGGMTVQFYNSLGQLAKTVESTTNSASVSGLQTGVYFVRITQGEQRSVQKLIVRQ